MNDDAKPVRILLAQTQPAARRYLAEALEDEGYDLLQVGDATALMDELTLTDDGSPPDLVLASVYATDCTALDVLQEARESDVDTPFVILNWSEDEVAREAEALEAVVLDYPFDLDDVLAAVADTLADSPDARAAA